MKGRSIDHVVYECMFPKPKPTDPQNFQGLLQRQLVPEVRLETQAFYGHLQTQEAKYPGLDYSYQPHRNRLSRFPWHRRLFRAFENLKLTQHEIAGLTKWEGTRWAKERFEREQGVVIRDTTSDGIEEWVEPALRRPNTQAHRADVEEIEDIQDGQDGEMEEDDDEESAEGEDEGNPADEMDEASDMDVLQSVGNNLNERLIAVAAARNAGDTNQPMDEEWEQWLKDAVEAGGIPFLSSELSPDANIPGTRPATDAPAIHPRILNAARLGQWQQIPEFLHNIVRENIAANTTQPESMPPSPRRSTPWVAPSWSISARAPSFSPRARDAPTSVSRSDVSRVDIDRSAISRLDSNFSDQLLRRPVPPLPSNTGSGASIRRVLPWARNAGS